MNHSTLPAGINQWLVNNKLKLELFLTLLSGIGILIHAFEKELGGEFMMIAMSAQAAFYFLLGSTTPDIEGKFAHPMYKIISITSSVCMIGFLFSILKFSGSDEMLFIGFIGMGISGLILLYCVFNRWNEKLLPLLVRVVILGVLVALVRLHVITF